MNDDRDITHELSGVLRDRAGTVRPESTFEYRAAVERRAGQRARRRRARTGVSAAAIVAVLAGGVWALRPVDQRDVRPAAGGAVVTGYQTGSMSGSPKGWVTASPGPGLSQTLPQFVLSDPGKLRLTSLGTTASNPGPGAQPLAPIAVVMGENTAKLRLVAASVQSPTTTGSGSRGKEIPHAGGKAWINRQSGSLTQFTVDIAGGHRIVATTFGLDVPTALRLIDSIHEQNGVWVMSPQPADGMTSIAAPGPKNFESYSVSYQDPATVDDTTTQITRANIEVLSGGWYTLAARLQGTFENLQLMSHDALATFGNGAVLGFEEGAAVGTRTETVLTRDGIVIRVARTITKVVPETGVITSGTTEQSLPAGPRFGIRVANEAETQDLLKVIAKQLAEITAAIKNRDAAAPVPLQPVPVPSVATTVPSVADTVPGQ
jgi:hypothetical protein